MAVRTPVYLEIGAKRVFASALDWPGWCRGAKDEQSALAALAAAAPRYTAVAKGAKLTFPGSTVTDFDVVERVTGNATTDFGAPGMASARDSQPVTAAQMDRIGALVASCWKVLDTVVVEAPARLRKGPRGGGRDRDQIVEHVLAAEQAYAGKLALKLKVPPLGDRAAVATFRREILGGLTAARRGAVRDNGWVGAYAARRIAWHALDHAWEIEDRSEPG